MLLKLELTSEMKNLTLPTHWTNSTESLINFKKFTIKNLII